MRIDGVAAVAVAAGHGFGCGLDHGLIGRYLFPTDLAA
jgi:hypothetical protein